jgi:hypothetical protein
VQLSNVSGQLKSNNVKLKGLVNQMRSSRNFCVDVILIIIIMAIGEPWTRNEWEAQLRSERPLEEVVLAACRVRS